MSKYTEAALIKKLQSYYESKGEVTSRGVESDPDMPSGKTYHNRFGTWNNALQQAGIQPNVLTSYDEGSLVNLLQEYYDTHGQITKAGFKSDPSSPSSGPVVETFGSWNDGLRAASLPVTEKGVPVDPSPDLYQPSEAKAYVIGVVIGDGCVYESNGWYIQLKAVDKEFVLEFGEQLSAYLNLNWNGWDEEATEIRCRGPIQKPGNRQVQWGVEKGIKPIYSHLRNYQDVVSIDGLLKEFQDFKPRLLRGLWDSEGSIFVGSSRRGGGYVGFSNSDDSVIELYIRLLGDVVGVDTGRSISLPESDEDGYVGDCYISDKEHKNSRSVFIYSDYINDFYRTVDPTIERKRARFKHSITRGVSN